ncbi:MAG: hypothetical protein AVDCRST_MAG58-343 [uncultured Rubrobacteraceae bacterium]|uniref:Uncharacterized protein n=1 Tax=uncultured Rubrobacteraceae bacterium TaxID=349277 RepID=A0A6J4QLA5_9ACTN|nr:MAG: hypothetical protein AVDCRST_MAG58-343 [uncultured Rubrobacteraceae bacterium]
MPFCLIDDAYASHGVPQTLPSHEQEDDVTLVTPEGLTARAQARATERWCILDEKA